MTFGNLLILIQFFFIIFNYHILKDLKDTLIITASDAGADAIPFIKIWVILPFSLLASLLFTYSYNKVGREKTFYLFICALIGLYCGFAFLLYPNAESLHFHALANYMEGILPKGCIGLTSIIRYWSYTLFYLASELWSLMILSILFWGYLNDKTSMDQAKYLYPLCAFTGNIAGIISGQASNFLCQTFSTSIGWELTLQLLVTAVACSGGIIILINSFLPKVSMQAEMPLEIDKPKPMNFSEVLSHIFKSKKLLCIALLVIGFGMTNNLIEIVWKKSIKSVYSAPQDYNSYINQLTSIIGFLAVVMALASRYLFRKFQWHTIILVTPILLLITSATFFSSILLPEDTVSTLALIVNSSNAQIILFLGTIHYIVSLTAKYTIFDMTKEMAFLSIDKEQRLKSKSIIDSVGSRFGKSGSSCLYQILLISFGTSSDHIFIIAIAAITSIAFSLHSATKIRSLSTGSTRKSLTSPAESTELSTSEPHLGVLG